LRQFHAAKRWLGRPDWWSKAVNQFTPKTLADLYALLSDENKTAFLRLLGQHTTAEQILALQKDMPILEKGRYMDARDKRFVDNLFPTMLREAIQAAREFPQAGEVELAQLVIDRLAACNQRVRDLALAQHKQKQYPANKVKDRRKAIQELLASHPGMTPKQILEYLLEHHGELATTKKQPVELKTILNDLAEIRKQVTPKTDNAS